MLKFKLFGKEYCISKVVLFAVILPVFLVIAAFIFITGHYISRSSGGIIVEKQSVENLPDESSAADKTNIVRESSQNSVPRIKVYVVGAVMHPGVVELEKGQIIEDAIKAAGGAKPEADLENINLAYILNENVMIKIKSKNEVKSEKKAAGGKTNAHQDRTVEGITISKDSKGAIAGENTSSKETESKININTATLEELDKLDGVGQATAKKIMDYREKNGSFKTIDDIKKVSGIGDAKFNSFKDMITVG